MSAAADGDVTMVGGLQIADVGGHGEGEIARDEDNRRTNIIEKRRGSVKYAFFL